MDDHSDDIRRPLSPRIEVYAGAGRKRWPDDLKAQIAAESLEPGAIVTDVARRHGCRPQQVHDWRRRARLGQLVLPASADTLSFVPVVSESALPVAAEAAVVTVEFQGARVEVRETPGLAVLSDVFMRFDGHVHADAAREPHDLRGDATCGLQKRCGGPGAVGEGDAGP
ncbi:transposase [Bradyrhizobium sp. WSM2793]|uniref:IS66-like element accessory protein TnpA n=1 Tax=Bradyrhizobium sp. WSM2793 TaxID=1038866 RepID=UPI000364799C